ncbi:MAG: ribosome maturation factor RimM [Gammaproteobacteria bacterium]|nr:ribosome maturation factor RimM [Gammaproteobacteria bacterium]
MHDADGKLVPMGKVSGVFGLQGWVKVFSDTDPREGILDYKNWSLLNGREQSPVELEKGKRHGKGVIAKFKGVDDRNAASLLVGRTIAISRDELPALAGDEYYWSDLIGMEVVNTDGVALGLISSLFATGANDVIVVKADRERLIPWIREQVIKDIDMENRRMEVDWDPDF